MTEYLPETSICAVQLDSQASICNKDTSDTPTSEAISLKMEDHTELGITIHKKTT